MTRWRNPEFIFPMKGRDSTIKRTSSERRNAHTPVNLTPLLEVSCHNLLDIVRDMYPPHIECPVLPHKGAYAAHVVPVIAELVPPKTVDIRIEQVMQSRKAMQILALLPARTQAPGEEEAKVAAHGAIRASVAAVACNVAARRCGGLGEIFVFAIPA